MMIVSLINVILLVASRLSSLTTSAYTCSDHVGMREHLRHGVDVGAGGDICDAVVYL